jgi:hypothetical protein
VLVVENEIKLREVIPTLRSMIAESIVVLLDAAVIPAAPMSFTAEPCCFTAV